MDDYRGALRFLGRFVNLEASAGRIHGLSLDAMRGLVGAMGDPQHDVRTLHVTGTNGKGSVSAMVSALLGAAGLRVGGYTSPHVDTVREMFDDRFVRMWRYYLTASEMSFSELGLVIFQFQLAHNQHAVPTNREYLYP